MLLGCYELVIVREPDLEEGGIGDAGEAHDEEGDGEEVDWSAHGSGMHQLDSLADFEGVDVVVVSHHQVVLPLR